MPVDAVPSSPSPPRRPLLAVPSSPSWPVLFEQVAAELRAAAAAPASVGHVHRGDHRGDLGAAGRETFHAPGGGPPRHVYVCTAGTLGVRNHLAVRDVLRARPDLREEYASVTLALAADPEMDTETYVAGTSAVLQGVLAVAGLTGDERQQILRLDDPSA